MSHYNLPQGPGFVTSAWFYIRRPIKFYPWLRRRYGEFATVRSIRNSIVMVLTSEGARQLLTTNPDSYDAFHKEAFAGLAGPGSLWVLEGSRHRRERQLLSPRFSADCVRGYGQSIKQTTLRYTDAWQPGQSIRAYDAMLDISRDVILRLVFGFEREHLMEDGRRVLKRVLKCAHPMLCFDRVFQRWWFPPWLRFQRAKREFSKFVARCLTERGALGTESQGLLGHMIAAQYDDGSSISDGDIRDELITILMAGHETTAVALSWALYEIVRHPAVLVRLREELDALGQDPAPDAIVRQPYLGAVCNETLRLHTIVTEIGRISRVPCELLGRQFPAGASLGVGIGAIHQDPSLYAEPDKFRPERFLERKYSAFEFLPFGGSHRRCLGAHLSDYEMRIALAMILTRWELELTGADFDIRHNIAAGPKRGVCMRVTGRRKPADLSVEAPTKYETVLASADEVESAQLCRPSQRSHWSQVMISSTALRRIAAVNTARKPNGETSRREETC